MNGYDSSGEITSLAKNILQQCEGEPKSITLEKSMLKLILTAYLQQWHIAQDSKRSEYKKVANDAR